MEAFAALASAFFFAVGQIWVRIGLQYAPPLSAVAISNAGTALWVWLTLAPFVSFASRNLWALEVGTVVIVAPLISATPLFTVILSALYLRSYERVTAKIALGAAAICLGGVMLIAFRF